MPAVKKRVKSKRPENTAFKQQRLKAWQPLLTHKSVLPTLFLIGIIFIPLGGYLYWQNKKLIEITIDYTRCGQEATSEYSRMKTELYKYEVPEIKKDEIKIEWKSSTSKQNVQVCTLRFPITHLIEAPVYFYYKLTNFYQNHRNYVSSVSIEQLRGAAVPKDQLGVCAPLDVEDDGKIIYPCGFIANSMFNDSFSELRYSLGGEQKKYQFTTDGITWESDENKFKTTTYNIDDIVPPPNWRNRYKDGKYSQDQPPTAIAKDPHFQTWMRTAALPTFKKLYGIGRSKMMPYSQYEIDIELNYDTTIFHGTKSIVFATTSFLGAKNSFLGLCYIIIGAICFVLAIMFTARHLYKPRRLGDHSYLSWN